jgi:hypothetical protein
MYFGSVREKNGNIIISAACDGGTMKELQNKKRRTMKGWLQ